MNEQPNPPVLKILAFGGFQVLSPDGRTIPLSVQKDRALLGFLATSPGVAHPRERLASLLWSDGGNKQARDSLKQAIFRLRRSLKPFAGDLLVTDRQSATLCPNGIWIDVDVFEDALRRRTPESIEQAATLYGGDLLEDILVQDVGFQDWLLIERQRLRALATDAWAELMTLSLEIGHRARAVLAARRLLALEPLHEGACRTLMQVHMERSERTQALKLFKTLRSNLRRDLNVEPEPETIALYRAIRGRGTAAARSEGSRESADPHEAPDMDASGGASAPSALPAIAVLPFDNLSCDPDQEYFSDGITADIITELSRFRTLVVIARNSSFSYKGQSPRVQEVGSALGVQYVVEGSVRRAGSRVRINAELVDTGSGSHLWAERYDREIEDIFAVQDEVVQAVAAAIPERVDIARASTARHKPTEILTAYDCLLRGKWHLRRDFGDREARAMFAQAIEIDPQCARAHARLAIMQLYDVFRRGVLTEDGACMARDHAEQALKYDDRDALIHVTAAYAYLVLGEHDLAECHSHKAIALNPNDVDTIALHGHVATYLGDPLSGLDWLRKSQRLDPMEPEALLEKWLDAYYMARQYDQAIAVFRRIRIPPVNLCNMAAACYAQLGQMGAARDLLDRIARMNPRGYDFRLAATTHARMCRDGRDGDHWLDGYRKAGFEL